MSQLITKFNLNRQKITEINASSPTHKNKTRSIEITERAFFKPFPRGEEDQLAGVNFAGNLHIVRL
jgi:hypothetical protein